MENIRPYETIDLYLKGKLSEAEKYAFEKELASDVSLQELVKNQASANQVVITNQLMKLKTKMSADLKQLEHKRMYRNWGLFSFGVVTVGLIGYMMIQNATTEEMLNPIESPTSTVEIKDSTIKPFVKQVEVTSPPSSKEIVLVEKNNVVVESVENLSSKIDQPIQEPIIPIKEKEIAEEIKVIPIEKKCGVLNFNEFIQVSATCKDEQKGKISISTKLIKGGNSPYLCKIGDAKDFVSKTDYSYLNAGEYLITIKDNEACLYSTKITIAEKECAANQSFIFTPSLENWKIPVKENGEGIIKIFNKSGILVYTSSISSTKENYWDGRSSNGNLLETGYYPFILVYSDNEQIPGSITIRE